MVKPSDGNYSASDADCAEKAPHMPYEFWVEDVLGPLSIAQTILSSSILVLGVACTVFEACQLGTGVWVGVLTVCSAVFGLLAVRNPYSQGFFIAYMASSVVACASACILAYVTGVETVFNALQLKSNYPTKSVAASAQPAAYIGVVALNGILLSLSVGFLICSTISCVRMCNKMREPDPCCTKCMHDFPGPVVYMAMGPQTKHGIPPHNTAQDPRGRRRSRSK